MSPWSTPMVNIVMVEMDMDNNNNNEDNDNQDTVPKTNKDPQALR